MLVCWFVLSGLRNPNLFAGVNKNLSLQSPSKLEENRPEKVKELLHFIENKKPYLDDQLSIQKLAASLDIQEKQLSSLINKNTGKHFFDFINSFRIKDAKRLLLEAPDLTVLEILYQVGFNSKSSFYTAFKKETGTTPTTFRKSNS